MRSSAAVRFTARDTSASQPVCIVNEEFARRYLADRNPLGAKVSVQSLDYPPKHVCPGVVGVSGQVKERPNAPDNQLEIYVPIAQNAWYGTTLVVRTAGAPMSFVPSIKAAVARIQKNMAVTRIRTMDDVAEEATAIPRFRAQLLGFRAAGDRACGCGRVQRVHVHRAAANARVLDSHGAGCDQVPFLRLVLGNCVKVAAVGLVIGVAASLALVRSMESLLFAVTPFNPMTFAGASALLALVALAACALPAIRAAQWDPAVALRQE